MNYLEAPYNDDHIRFDETSAKWSAKREDNENFIAFTNSYQIFGTTTWTIINDSNLCPDSHHTTKTITFSFILLQ